MYSYIKGSLEEVREDLIVVENNGIGYNIRIPMRLLDTLPSRGEAVKIYTYLYVREDAFSLFGFSSNEELNLFKLLLNVSGIGPKGALAILSVMSPADVKLAIVNEDAKAIAKAQGVGNKTAQRVIIELKDKVDLEETLETMLDGGADVITSSNSKAKKEAIEALVALGYTAKDATSVLGSIEVTEDMDVETVLKLALKNMAFL